MASAVASIVLRRAVCRSFPSLTPIRRPRCLPTLTSSCVAIRGLISRTLVRPSPAISVRHASSSTWKDMNMINRADKNLLSVLEYDMKCADGSWATKQEVTLPEDSPFEIVDDPGCPSIILKREFQGEKVEVTVFMNLEEDDDEGKNASGDTQPFALPSVSLVVTINEGDGPNLEFCCSMDSERLRIERMTLRRPGEVDDNDGGAYGWPAFSGLHEDLQKAFHNYLVVRGIKPSLYDFLRDYLFNKEAKEFVIFLKKLTELVAKGVVTRDFCRRCMSKKNRPAKH